MPDAKTQALERLRVNVENLRRLQADVPGFARQAQEAGATLAEIGAAAGMTRQGAQKMIAKAAAR